MHHFKSGLLAAANYDEKAQTLTLDFHTGSRYTYENVSHEIYLELTRAESAGGFFQKNIRTHFHGVKVVV